MIMRLLTDSRTNMKPVWLALVFAMSLANVRPARAGEDWHPAHGPLLTRWAKDVTPANAHPEYPRPQLVRKDWQNLNGLWDYAIRPRDGGSPGTFDGKIL